MRSCDQEHPESPNTSPPQAGSRSAPRSRSRYRNPEGYIPDSELEVRKETSGRGGLRLTYYYNGTLHRDGGPALVWYKPDGSVSTEVWYQNGKEHHDNGPAWVEYRPNGSVVYEEWLRHGKKHRDDGPAAVRYGGDGSVEYEMWYRNGKEVPLGSR